MDYMINEKFPLWVVVLMAGGILAFVIFLTSEMDDPPGYHKVSEGFSPSVSGLYGLISTIFIFERIFRVCFRFRYGLLSTIYF